MRLPSSSARLVAVLAFACLSLALVVIAPGALAVGRGGGGNLEQVEARLAMCKRDLAQARGAVNDAEEFLSLARRQAFLLLPVPGVGVVPVSVRAATDAVVLEYLTGKISRAEMVRRLQNVVRRARQTVRALQELIADGREGVERIEKRCAALAEERDRLRRGGGGGGGGGGTGAYPGGTATKMTLTIEGHTGTIDLKTGTVAYEGNTSDAPGTKRGTVSGSVSLNGTLPAGWNIYVAAEGKIAHKGQGSFSIKDPIGSQRRVGASAQICSSPPAENQPYCVTGNGKANMTVFWVWVP